MTILLAAVAGLALAGCVALVIVLARHDWRAGEQIADLENQRYEDGALIAMLRREVDVGEVEVADLHSQLTRVTGERDKAIRDGGLATRAAVLAADRERDEFLESLRAWILIANVAMWVGTTRALPGAPAGDGPVKAIEPPKPLPSGDFLVEDGTGPLILPPGEWDHLDASLEALPVGTAGTRAD